MLTTSVLKTAIALKVIDNAGNDRLASKTAYMLFSFPSFFTQYRCKAHGSDKFGHGSFIMNGVVIYLFSQSEIRLSF